MLSNFVFLSIRSSVFDANSFVIPEVSKLCHEKNSWWGGGTDVWSNGTGPFLHFKGAKQRWDMTIEYSSIFLI